MVVVQSEMKPILCAGLVCLDQVTVVTSYPTEDTDMRSVGQYKVNDKEMQQKHDDQSEAMISSTYSQ